MVVGCVGTGYVLRVELPVQRRLYPIFVRDVGSLGIHERFRGLTGSQRTPGIWGVIQSLPGVNFCVFHTKDLAFVPKYTPHSESSQGKVLCLSHYGSHSLLNSPPRAFTFHHHIFFFHFIHFIFPVTQP